jgi:hypothetical protein
MALSRAEPTRLIDGTIPASSSFLPNESTVSMCSGPAPTRQWSHPCPEGGVKALDVGVVDQCRHRTLAGDHPADRLRPGARDDLPDHFHHPPTPVTFLYPGDHHAFRQHQLRTAHLARVQWLAEDPKRLALVAGEPICDQKDLLYSATVAYPPQRLPDQRCVAARADEPTQPQPASDLQRRGQPVARAHRLDADLVGLHLYKRYTPSLNEMLVNPACTGYRTLFASARQCARPARRQPQSPAPDSRRRATSRPLHQPPRLV